MKEKNDFSQGSMAKNIISMAVPMMVAQLINVLYNVVDRMYIGRIEGTSALALTGVGITFPIISMIIGFSNLFGMGGAPLCSIERGRGREELAEKIMGNSFSLLLGSGIILTIVFLIWKKPILYLFGASDNIYPYADGYLSIYLLGTVSVMIGLGMNQFINAQGFGKIGMMTVLLGAVINIILDPIFIFGFQMGVKGAALATVIAQTFSAVWVLKFLCGSKAILKIRKRTMKLEWKLVKQITELGFSGFVMALTNSGVQIICNASLQNLGGDAYVGVMTIISSIREILTMPVSGIGNGAQPVLGFNYGAKQFERVKKGIVFMTITCIIYTTLAWGFILFVPELFIKLFNRDVQLLELGVPALHIYFFGFCFMALQFSGQSAFLALGKARQAVFFSLFRKAIIVIPLTLFLPNIFGLGIDGVFWAEPISNVLGGIACFTTMLFVIKKELGLKNINVLKKL